MQISVIGHRSYLIKKAIKRLPIDCVRYLDNPAQLSHNDDIAFCLSYYRIIKHKYFSRPKHGVFIAHASDLPKDRGWAPVNQALIRGDEKIFVTSFKMDEECDTGPYYMKSYCDVDITDTITNAYDKVEAEMVKHIRSILKQLLEHGSVDVIDQEGTSTWNDKRSSKDSELDPSKSLIENWNLLRACCNEDYPAFFVLNNKKIYLRYEVKDV